MPMAAQAAPELITNGNFDTTASSSASANGNFQITTAGGTYGTVNGWTSAGGYNLLFRTNAIGSTTDNSNTAETTTTAYSPNASTSGAYTQYATNANNSGSNERLAAGYNKTSPVGGNFVALDGDSQFSAALQQTVNGLTIGTTYQLLFYWAVSELVTGGAAPNGLTESLKVTFGNSTATTAVVGIADGGFSGWMRQTYTFTATSTSQVLSFLSIGTPNGAPPMALLDGVSLTAVPEPSSIILVTAAIGGVAFLRRRRTAQKAA